VPAQIAQDLEPLVGRQRLEDRFDGVAGFIETDLKDTAGRVCPGGDCGTVSGGVRHK
jgi:hypothetical protein